MSSIEASRLPPGTTAGDGFGSQLREWRQRRRYTQLALALEAGTSARHLSFLETGRAAPSREMVHRLADHLEIPLRERNLLLLAAGYAPEYPERPLTGAAMAAARAAVESVLAAFEPFPALAVDRHWTIVSTNRAVGPLLAGAAPHLLEPPVNALRLSLHPDGLASRIANLAQWRASVLRRLQHDAAGSGDGGLQALLDELRSLDDGGSSSASSDEGPFEDVAVPLVLRTEHGELSFISTTTVFGTATDVTLAELAIECFLPANEGTRRILRALVS